MLDAKFVVENLELIRTNCARRGVTVDLDRLVALDGQRREKLQRVEELNRQANQVSKSIGQAKSPEEREARKLEGRNLREETTALQSELDVVVAEFDSLLRGIPNLTHPDAPVGMEPREIRRGKTKPREFDFKPLDHVEIGRRLDLVDFEAAAKISGHGFYFLKNEAVLLELALQRYALDVLTRAGFTPTVTPDLAREEIVYGTGYMPRGPETQIYAISHSDLCLVATAEITLGGMYAKEILDEERLPIKICGISHCFRTEAGAHGADARGLFRVHQFTKVEMFVYARPEESDDVLNLLRDIECQIFDGLGIPYKVIDTPSEDLGGPAYRKFDLEAWMPGRGEAGQWGEVTSTSNCTDFQARRLGVRFRKKGEKGTTFVHTLNGTAIAISRAIVAVLENYQQADGSVVVPDVLQPWMGMERIGPR